MATSRPTFGVPEDLAESTVAAGDHPRPLVRRPAWRTLDGPWAFRRGDDTEASPPRHHPDTITVPFAPESRASGIGDLGYHPVLWYRRRLDVPAAWIGRRLLLHLAGVEGSLTVWLDGLRVASLAQAFAPTTLDLTDLLGPGGALLDLRIERDPLDLGAVRGKQDWQPEAHSIWYPRSSGLTRTVWWEAVPAQHVRAIEATADLAAFALDVHVDLDGLPNGTPVDAGWRLAVSLHAHDQVLADERWSVAGPSVRRRVQLEDPGIDDARERLLWSPEHPNLIDLKVRLERDGEVIDEVASYTAFRTVGVDADAFLLNGRPYRLRLVLDQGYWPESHRTAPAPDALRRDVELTKALGFNGVRKHQTLEDPRYYAWADRLGLLVWSELPSAYRFSATTVAALSERWSRQIERDRGYPCVVAWVAFNESWGVPDLLERADQRHAVRALYHLAKALDPSRPVIGNDGWEAVVGDLWTVHDYAADPALLAARYGTRADLARTLDDVRPARRRIRLPQDLEGVASHASRPVVLSEFGGVRASAGEGGWGYAEVEGEGAFLERYTALVAAITPSALAGFCYTQLTDTFQEQNGLLTMDRRPKADLVALARATRGEGEPLA